MKKSAFEDFSEGVLGACYDAYDFKTCKRSDGTTYGTSGDCAQKGAKEVKKSDPSSASVRKGKSNPGRGKSSTRLSANAQKYINSAEKQVKYDSIEEGVRKQAYITREGGREASLPIAKAYHHLQKSNMYFKAAHAARQAGDAAAAKEIGHAMVDNFNKGIAAAASIDPTWSSGGASIKDQIDEYYKGNRKIVERESKKNKVPMSSTRGGSSSRGPKSSGSNSGMDAAIERAKADLRAQGIDPDAPTSSLTPQQQSIAMQRMQQAVSEMTQAATGMSLGQMSSSMAAGNKQEYKHPDGTYRTRRHSNAPMTVHQTYEAAMAHSNRTGEVMVHPLHQGGGGMSMPQGSSRSVTYQGGVRR